MQTAAFFDLDRTLLRGASGPAFSAAMKAEGLLPDRSIPGEALVFKVFDVIGETIPSMIATRQMARAAAGWERARVQAAGRAAAAELVDAVPGFARQQIAHHRSLGHPVVMATTSPHDLVEPLAKALGMEAVIATRYGEHEGRYDGSVDGFFVWGPGKLAAVRAWAAEHGVDVSASFAYSDVAGDESKRTVRPLAMHFWGKVWTLIAWCELSGDFRMFRVDLVETARPLPELFVDEPGKRLSDLPGTAR